MLSYHINPQHTETDTLHVFVVNELPYGDSEVVASFWIPIVEFVKLIERATKHLEALKASNDLAAKDLEKIARRL